MLTCGLLMKEMIEGSNTFHFNFRKLMLACQVLNGFFEICRSCSCRCQSSDNSVERAGSTEKNFFCAVCVLINNLFMVIR